MLRNWREAKLAVLYDTFLEFYKFGQNKNQPLVKVESQALKKIKWDKFMGSQVEDKFVYILSENTLFIINLEA